jgi:hypothetical protein
MRSAFAILAGILVVVAATTAVDVVLHWAHVYPTMGVPLDHWQSLIATSYRAVIGVAGGWFTAKLAPARPMTHAIGLGIVGTFLGIAGLVVTWNMGLSPRWYPIALAALALPQSWLGGRLYESKRSPALT